MRHALAGATLVVLFLAMACWDPAGEDTSPPADTESPSDTEPSDTASPSDTGEPDPPAYLDYRYARIDDLSEDEREGTPGAEIDAVELRASNGSPKGYAVNIVAYVPVNEDINDHMDPSEAAGAPSPECYDDQGFVNLGGTGGFLIVDFGTHIIESNDTLIVYEVGGCRVGGDGPMTIEDPVAVAVSTQTDPSGSWEPIGYCDGGTCTFPVGTLPLVPASDD